MQWECSGFATLYARTDRRVFFPSMPRERERDREREVERERQRQRERERERERKREGERKRERERGITLKDYKHKSDYE